MPYLKENMKHQEAEVSATDGADLKSEINNGDWNSFTGIFF